MTAATGRGRWSPSPTASTWSAFDRAVLGRTSDALSASIPLAGVIGIVGRLTPVKGHALFLRAARRILDEAPRTRFVIVGDGPLRTELERTARELGVAEACVFVGARMDVYDLVGAMDVFVLSSLHEGAPMAPAGGDGTGHCPSSPPPSEGSPRSSPQGTTGLLVGGQDASGLAAACLELVRNPEWARRMAERARRVAVDKFSHRRCGAALVGTYHAVTHRPRRAGPGLSSWVAALARGLRRSATAALGSSARRRVESERREPASLREALRSARQILVVCHGNIIRSPFAAHLLAQKLEDGCPLRIVSRGLGARPGTPSPAPATLAAAGFQVDLTTHVALPVSVGDVAASDVIFVMDVAQLRQMERRHPAARGKTFLLTSLAPDCAARSARSVRPRRLRLSSLLRAHRGLRRTHRPPPPRPGTRRMKAAIKQLPRRDDLRLAPGRPPPPEGGGDRRLSSRPRRRPPRTACPSTSRCSSGIAASSSATSDVVPLADIVEKLERGAALRIAQLAITFDDGYRDNFAHAATRARESRACRRRSSSSASGWGRRLVPWWDGERGVRHPWMTWDQVRTLHQEGVRHRRAHADPRRSGSVTGSKRGGRDLRGAARPGGGSSAPPPTSLPIPTAARIR